MFSALVRTCYLSTRIQNNNKKKKKTLDPEQSSSSVANMEHKKN